MESKKGLDPPGKSWNLKFPCPPPRVIDGTTWPPKDLGVLPWNLTSAATQTLFYLVPFITCCFPHHMFCVPDISRFYSVHRISSFIFIASHIIFSMHTAWLPRQLDTTAKQNYHGHSFDIFYNIEEITSQLVSF